MISAELITRPPTAPVSNGKSSGPVLPCLHIAFGQARSGVEVANGLRIDLSLPVLGGLPARIGPLEPGTGTCAEGFATWVDGAGHQWGAGVLPWPGEPLEGLARVAYDRVFALAEGRVIHRLWNFVPRINAVTTGLENYRRFCVGRSEAFEACFGDHANAYMPAGSAVGIEESVFVVVFRAGPEPAMHFENPLQLPAYHYPHRYSPRPPCFARATRVNEGAVRHLHLSGTSAVRGHGSVASGDLQGQISTTLEMLEVLGQSLGIGPELARGRALSRQFIIYVRHADDFPAIAQRLSGELLVESDDVTYLQADICRQELLLEIEGSIRVAQ